jgi:hypothetical protein
VVFLGLMLGAIGSILRFVATLPPIQDDDPVFMRWVAWIGVAFQTVGGVIALMSYGALIGG